MISLTLPTLRFGSNRGKHAKGIEHDVHFGEVLATLYHQLGVDITHVTLPDLSGRPQYLVDVATDAGVGLGVVQRVDCRGVHSAA
jgi:hypothetical protein